MKKVLINIIVYCAYWFGVNRIFYFLNRHSKRIVTFHNVIPVDLLSSEDENIICFSDVKFERIVDEISRRFYFSNDVNDSQTCTLTFDDGYVNQLEVAGRILRDKGIPAILFLSRQLLDSDKPLVVDQCAIWADKVPMNVAEKGFGRVFENRVALWQQAVRPLFAADGDCRGRAALEKLNDIWPIGNALEKFSPEFRRLRFTGITKEMLLEYQKAGWIFGHHTYSHFPVKDLTVEAARKEMTPPADMLGTVFSFPYGDEGSVCERDVKIVQELGYPCAVSNEVEFTPLIGRYFMPRFMLTTDNKYFIHFQLSGFKYFLKYRRLLPRCVF